MNTVSTIEVIWTIANVLGLIAAWKLLSLGFQRRASGLARGYPPNGPHILTANRRIRDKGVRVTAHAASILLGVMSMADLDLGIITAWVLVGMMVLFLMASLWDLHDERLVLKGQRDETRRKVRTGESLS